MAINRYDKDMRIREDLVGQLTPNCFVQDQVRAPAPPPGGWRPADWLPIQFQKTEAELGTDHFVISKGKVVAQDSQGFIVPAGLALALGGTGSAAGKFAGTVLSYTATDVAQKVQDLVTGLPVAAAVSYTGEQVADALIERGLVREADAVAAGGTVPATADAHLAVIIDLFISAPIGVAAYDFYVWSGRPEEGTQKFANYSQQSSVAFLTEVQMKVPLRVAGSLSNDDFVTATLDGAGSTTYAAGSAIAAGEYWDAANIASLNRYASVVTASTPVVALGLAQANVARETDRTPITCDVDGVLTRSRPSISLVTKEGDYFLDHEVGVLFLHEDTWATLVGGTTTITLTYNYYTDTGVASAHRFVHFDGPVRPGAHVTFDDQSNLTVASAAVIAAGARVVGRAHFVLSEADNHSLMQQVKTAWALSGVTSASQMPGSATKGFSDLITLSQETVADNVVYVNIRI